MKKKSVAKAAMKLMLAVTLIAGVSLASAPEKTNASMGCYGWFDFYYKVTGDLDFAYYGFNVCQKAQ
ncbi:hypothetical protein [Paenibacillus sp. GCM10027626]|uniref:hypothetical protein n=1 Tax=Paenibacillus sp. GCM10027626 TaxID=3273411 RepID=UPI0036351496